LRADEFKRYERDDDRLGVDKLREELSREFTQLAAMQDSAGVHSLGRSTGPVPEDPAEGPQYIDPNEASVAPRHADTGTARRTQDVPPVLPIETQRIGLPSNKNVTGDYGYLELKFRLEQAKGELNVIRELIAAKSFNYSHVIRVTRDTGVRTRARTANKQVDLKIRLHTRIYGRCRARMAVLGATDSQLETYQILRDEHLKADTTMLKPNVPGSRAALKLSWIWKSVTGHLTAAGQNPFYSEPDAGDRAAITECKCERP
jgi:hypothetical protein